MKISCGGRECDVGAVSFKQFRVFAHKQGWRYVSWEDGSWIEVLPTKECSETEILSKIR